MHYPGDTIIFVLPLQRPDGSGQAVGTAPKITVLNAADGTTALASTVMPVLSGTTYKYAWSTVGLTDGLYVAFVSYVADGLVVQDKFLAQVQLGDSRITGPVALDQTVAKDATVAKADTVLNRADYVTPDDSVLVQAISDKLASLPVGIANEATAQAILALVRDICDGTLGSLMVNKVENTLTILRRDNTPLQVFQLENTDDYSSRVRL